MEKNEYAIMYGLENTYWWYRGLHELIERYVRRHAKTTAGPLSLLDAGCGTGRMLEILGNYGAAEGFDYSEEALNFCKKRGLTNVFRQDLNTWQPPLEKYDVIISLDVLYHVNVISEDESYQKFLSALKPGGLLILNLPAFELLRRRHDKAVHTKKRYTKRATLKKIRTAGFNVESVSYRLPFLFGIMLLKKMIESVSHDKTVRSDLASLPQWLNGVILFFNRLENAIVFSGASLPLGGSLFIVCRK
jgi:2-polyprenyl-3-methyl-5-hydroxy-6-metoxy-1,4-benzoquinol methylase